MTLGLALALGATIVVETLIASILLRRFVWLESLGIQLTTWPIAQLLVWRTGRFWLVELGVAVAETVLWRLTAALPWRRAAVVSLAANGMTALIAVAVSRS